MLLIHDSCRRRWPIAGLVLVLLVGAVPSLQAQEPTGAEQLAKIAAAQNVVESRRAGAAEWNAAASGKLLFGNDRVRTGAGSRAAILYALISILPGPPLVTPGSSPTPWSRPRH